MILDTSTRQTGAIRLYEKHGFEKFREENDGDFRVLWYRKDLRTRSRETQG